MFDRVRQLGYRSDLIGYYINYRALLGPDGADHIESLPYAYKRRTWRSEVGLMMMRNLQHWTDPVSQLLWPIVSSVVYSQSWVIMHQSMRESLDRALTELPENTFLLAHLPLPHAPFIFEPDGTFRGRYEGERMSNDSAGYSRNLRYTDVVLGEMLDALERAGRLDRSLIVATSDHAWRKEPDSTIARQPDAEIRVPLLIKWPGQDRPLVSDEPYCELGLWPVFQAAMTPPAPPPMTDSLWQALAAAGRERHCTR
jgi:arylsulfatase A-like enzyme